MHRKPRRLALACIAAVLLAPVAPPSLAAGDEQCPPPGFPSPLYSPLNSGIGVCVVIRLWELWFDATVYVHLPGEWEVTYGWVLDGHPYFSCVQDCDFDPSPRRTYVRASVGGDQCPEGSSGRSVQVWLDVRTHPGKGFHEEDAAQWDCSGPLTS